MDSNLIIKIGAVGPEIMSLPVLGLKDIKNKTVQAKQYCPWCRGTTPDDSQGACIACSGPREKEESRHQTAMQRYAGGFLTVNEIRTIEGFSPLMEVDPYA